MQIRKALLPFHYLMDLHYSQTVEQIKEIVDRFTTLWIYTILKLKVQIDAATQPFHYLMDLHYSQTKWTKCEDTP